jgi:cytochrome c peroxidase
MTFIAKAPIWLAATAVLLAATLPIEGPIRWKDDEVSILESLSLSALGPLPTDPTNRFADDPRAAALGQQLFFDERFSSNGQVSCGTCHAPELDFQDGKPLAQGVGTTARRTMPVASTAYSTWFFWDGRKDSQWAQALGPLESAVEHGGTRSQYAHLVAEHYANEFEDVFGPLPNLDGVPQIAGPVDDLGAREAWEAMSVAQQEDVNRIFANIGKAIAAYERRIAYAPSRFDAYVDSLVATGHAPEGVLTQDEAAGARLFIGKADCVSCHNGPLFTDDYFHNTGVPASPSLPSDLGRASGATAVLADEFNCRSAYSDAAPEACVELEYIVVESEELVRAFKTPSLRNVAGRAPYMHQGQIGTLDVVVRHYRDAPRAPEGRSELHPHDLIEREMRELVAFLESLSAPIRTPAPTAHDPR